VAELVDEIRKEGVLHEPVLVDIDTLTILDGHHRVSALRRLGARWVPAVLVDYMGELVRVESWRPGISVSKEEVIARARRGLLYPPKTTRHRVLFELPRVDLGVEILLNGYTGGEGSER